ncbi:MAG: hypothetical protein ABEK01_01005 [Candidatus Nanohaloarchaea archaeon]
MGLEKEPTEADKEEYEEATVLGDATPEEFAGLEERTGPKEDINLIVRTEPSDGGKKVLAVTNKRAISFTSGDTRLLGEKNTFQDLKIDSIEDIEVQEREGFDRMKVSAAGPERTFMVPPGTGVKVAGHIREIQENPDPTKQLEKLEKKREMGAISPEEYEKERDRIEDMM